jgi:hypothetical protein
LEKVLEIEVRQASGQGFQADEAIDVGGQDRQIQAVEGLYMAAAGRPSLSSAPTPENPRQQRLPEQTE